MIKDVLPFDFSLSDFFGFLIRRSSYVSVARFTLVGITHCVKSHLILWLNEGHTLFQSLGLKFLRPSIFRHFWFFGLLFFGLLIFSAIWGAPGTSSILTDTWLVSSAILLVWLFVIENSVDALLHINLKRSLSLWLWMDMHHQAC